jgi:hypothetical protein
MSRSRHQTRVQPCAAIGITIAAVLAGGTTEVAATGRHLRPPAVSLDGSGTWQVREALQDVVVSGTAHLSGPNGKSARAVLMAAVAQAQDRTLPGPGECESADVTVSVYGARKLDFSLVGTGDVCGVDLQPPANIVTHVFTGTFEVYGEATRPRRLEGIDGFYEIRLADDGTASVFAIDT